MQHYRTIYPEVILVHGSWKWQVRLGTLNGLYSLIYIFIYLFNVDLSLSTQW